MSRIATLILAALAAACGNQSAAGNASPPAPIEVQSATVQVKQVPHDLRLVGSLVAQEDVAVSPEIGGTVVELPVDFGDRVERGAVLLRLDATELTLRAAAARAGVAQADAVVQQARSNYERAVALHKQQVVSKETLDGATRELQVAEANRDAAAKQLAIAEKHVADAVLRSPVTGFVAARHVAVGQYVAPYTPVMQLVVVDPLKLRFEAPERFVADVRTDLPVSVEIEAFPGEQFAGTVTRIGSTVDPTTRTLLVEGAIPNPDARLKPGQFAHVRLDLGRRDAIVIPRAALDTFAGAPRAFVIRSDGLVEVRQVAPGADLGAEVLILEGVHAGEAVATSQLERLADGVRVNPIREHGS